MPIEAQSYATSVVSSRIPSRQGDKRRSELNSTKGSFFPKIKKPLIEVVDLSGAALAAAMPTIRKTEMEIKRLNSSIEDIKPCTEYI